MSNQILLTLAEFRSDFKSEMAALRGDMNTGFATVNGRIDTFASDLISSKEAARNAIGFMDEKIVDLKVAVAKLPATEAVANMISTSAKDTGRFTIDKLLYLALILATVGLVVVDFLKK